VDHRARVCVRQNYYSVPTSYAGRRLPVRLSATAVEVLDGRRVVVRHERAAGKYGEVLTLDHYLEVLRYKPGALPGATALAQAKAAGAFTGTHQRYWDAARRARGDAAGTRALIEVLLAHRTLPAGSLQAAMAKAISSGVDPQVVLIDARREAGGRVAPVIAIGSPYRSGSDHSYEYHARRLRLLADAALAAVPLGMLWRRGIAGWPPNVFKGGKVEADVNERDRQEFAEFAAAHSGVLIRLAYVLTGDQLAAEDLLQTALTKAAARWGSIHSAPEAYVRQIMYREQVSEWRRRAHRGETTMADVPDQAAAVPAASAETRLALLEALRALPAGKRAVLALRYLEDLPEAQVADILVGGPLSPGHERAFGGHRRWTSHRPVCRHGQTAHRRSHTSRRMGALWCQMLQSAWVGDRRAARMAGRSPARAPMSRAAARPPAQAWGGMTKVSPWTRA
jgi:RNA polymerase sigma-70 factor (sigma-E family)